MCKFHISGWFSKVPLIGLPSLLFFKVDISYIKYHEAHQKSNFCRSYDVIESCDTSILSILELFLFKIKIETTSNRESIISKVSHTLKNIFLSETLPICNGIRIKVSNSKFFGYHPLFLKYDLQTKNTQ